MVPKQYIMIIQLWLCIFGLIGLMMMTACDNSSDRKMEKTAVPMSPTDSDDKTILHLYFSDRDNSFLIAEERSTSHQDNPVRMGSLIIDELLEGPGKHLIRTIPQQTTLRAFYLMADGMVVVDLSREIKEHHPGGAKSELMTIYSIVNSLILNIPEIKAVKLLIEGREAATLAGHIDLRSPFKANMLYVR